LIFKVFVVISYFTCILFLFYFGCTPYKHNVTYYKAVHDCDDHVLIYDYGKATPRKVLTPLGQEYERLRDEQNAVLGQ
jgi:hypothetical protein